jgi:DNA-binding NarL/FixJ family response regulator
MVAMRRRLLIVDDHAGFRSFAARLMSAAGFEVVGTASDGRSAVEMIQTVRPDVVLLDVQLPDTVAFPLVPVLTAEGAVVVLTSTRTAADYGVSPAECGAAGFLGKEELSGPALAALADAGLAPEG